MLICAEQVINYYYCYYYYNYYYYFKLKYSKTDPVITIPIQSLIIRFLNGQPILLLLRNTYRPLDT